MVESSHLVGVERNFFLEITKQINSFVLTLFIFKAPNYMLARTLTLYLLFFSFFFCIFFLSRSLGFTYSLSRSLVLLVP